MAQQKISVYFESLGNSSWVEWFAVLELDDGGSDLLSEGLSRWWRMPSDVSKSLLALQLQERATG